MNSPYVGIPHTPIWEDTTHDLWNMLAKVKKCADPKYIMYIYYMDTIVFVWIFLYFPFFNIFKSMQMEIYLCITITFEVVYILLY